MTRPPFDASPDVPAGSTGGVIHDIGFRHYDGPRLGRPAIARALAVDSLRGAFGLGRSVKSKIVPFVVLGLSVLVTLVVGLITAVTKQPRLSLGYTDFPGSVQVLVVIFLAMEAPQVVSRDVRHRVLSLYFSRPMGRIDYVLAKYAALASAAAIVLVAPLVVLLVMALLAKLDAGDQLLPFGRGVAVALMYALVMAAITELIAAITPRRGIGVAAIVGFFFLTTAVVTTVQGISSFRGNDTLATWLGLCDPMGAVRLAATWLFDAGYSRPGAAPTAVQGLAGLLVALGWVGGALAILAVRYRKVSVS